MVYAGRALAVALAGRGVRLSILDLDIVQGEKTVRLVEEEHAKISYKPSNSPSAIAIRCDVANSGKSHYPLPGTTELAPTTFILKDNEDPVGY